MMEGIASEAASLAGHLALANLCWIYDDNRITIEGSTELTFTEDLDRRFGAYGWNVVDVADANDLDALARAYENFAATGDRPTLIHVHSHIGYGSPNKHDSREAHGEPLGADEVRLVKEFFGWDPDREFEVPDGVREQFRAQVGARGARALADWHARFVAYRRSYPQLADAIDRLQRRELPPDWDAALPAFPADPKGLATRESSGKVLSAIAERMSWLLGGAADLAPSTKTRLGFEGAGDFEPPAHGGSYAGRNFHFGLREHAMCGIANGLALSRLRPFASSFLIFSD
jgi:transketolase